MLRPISNLEGRAPPPCAKRARRLGPAGGEPAVSMDCLSAPAPLETTARQTTPPLERVLHSAVLPFSAVPACNAAGLRRAVEAVAYAAPRVAVEAANALVASAASGMGLLLALQVPEACAFRLLHCPCLTPELAKGLLRLMEELCLDCHGLRALADAGAAAGLKRLAAALVSRCDSTVEQMTRRLLARLDHTWHLRRGGGAHRASLTMEVDHGSGGGPPRQMPLAEPSPRTVYEDMAMSQ